MAAVVSGHGVAAERDAGPRVPRRLNRICLNAFNTERSVERVTGLNQPAQLCDPGAM